MKPALLTLLACSLTPLAQAQLAVAPKPLIRLYSEGLAEGITLHPGEARCIVIRSFEAAPPRPKPGDSLRAGGFYGSALPNPQSIDSFCYDQARRLVRYRSFARGKDGMALTGNFDASFVSTDSGLLQTISYADMPGTTVTTLSNNDEIIWSHTFGRGMLAVEERHARFGGRREVSEKSFLLPWHRKRTEAPIAGGGWHVSTFVPRGPDTSVAAIQVADYDARHQPLLSYTLTPRPGGKSAGRIQYDTSDYVEYSYDKSGRLTAIGNVLRLEYGSKGTLPEVIVDSNAAGKPPAYWRVRYKSEGDRPTEVLLYERKPAPKAAKAPAYYFELHKKFEIAYLP
jgi:hypothetical protein